MELAKAEGITKGGVGLGFGGVALATGAKDNLKTGGVGGGGLMVAPQPAIRGSGNVF